MQINRANYEIWFIDWLDGNLNSLEAEALKHFLKENPDLREEFNDLSSDSLTPPSISFSDKDLLKKSPSDISVSQFEFMCTACLENDLSESQQRELKEIVDSSPDKKKTFNLIQKTRIIPPEMIYGNKNQLMKQTVYHKVIRLSFIGIAAAAAIALLLVTISVLQVDSPPEIKKYSQTVVPDSTLEASPSTSVAIRIPSDIKSASSGQNRKNTAVSPPEMKPEIANSELLSANPADTLPERIYDNEIRVNRVSINNKVDFKNEFTGNTLIAYNASIYIPVEEDQRSQIGRFISKTFREKLLKEKTPPDSPLKGYEIAEAGVSGLNKLFGWEMALDKRSDENGQLKSVYFSSKILKFSAPVKKSEPVQ
jgi:hypothetical protein